MEKTIKDLDIYISDGNYSSKYPRSEEFVEEGIPFIRGNNMVDGDISDDEMYYITPEKHAILLKGHVKAGDVLITTRGNIGQVAIVPERHEDSNINAQIVLLRTNPESLYNRYLLWALQSHRANEQYIALQTGTALKQLPVGKLEKLSIKVADIDEQHDIANTLDKVYEVIKERRKELLLLDDLIKARFVELFGDAEKMIPLSSLCDVSGGYSFKSGDITSDGAVKILQIGNVYLDDVNWEITNYLPEGYDETYSRFLLNEGDIVIALTRPIIKSLGNVKACIVKDSDMPCLLNQRVGRIVPKKNIEVSLKFIYGCLMTEGFTRYVESCCIGCSQPNISTKDIENYLIPDVSFNEQMEFVNFKEQVDKSKVVDISIIPRGGF